MTYFCDCAPHNVDRFKLETFSEMYHFNIECCVVILFSVLDTNDRYLRKITVGQSPTEKNHTREVQHSTLLL